MITTQTRSHRTGRFSRKINPRDVIFTSNIDARVNAGRNPEGPMRNSLAGADAPGMVARFAAWLRGER